MLRASAKDKGNRFEYDVEYSLKPRYPDIRALEKRGFARGYDLASSEHMIAIECKFHRAITWNELVKIFNTIRERAADYQVLVVFKTNMQPVLVFNGKMITTFADWFNVPFQVRPKGSGKEEPKDV